MNEKNTLVLGDSLGDGAGFGGAPALPMRWEARGQMVRATIEDFAVELRKARLERLKEQAFRLMAKANSQARCNQMMIRHYELCVARDDMGF